MHFLENGFYVQKKCIFKKKVLKIQLLQCVFISIISRCLKHEIHALIFSIFKQWHKLDNGRIISLENCYFEWFLSWCRIIAYFIPALKDFFLGKLRQMILPIFWLQTKLLLFLFSILVCLVYAKTQEQKRSWNIDFLLRF